MVRKSRRYSTHNHSSSESSDDEYRNKQFVINEYFTDHSHKGHVITQNILAFSDFYGIYPDDNSTPISPGMAVQFPRDGSTNGEITRINESTFNLKTVGTYEVQFQVPINETGQLVIALDSGSGFIENPITIVGTLSNNSQIFGITLINISTVNTKLSILNPSKNNSVLSITNIWNISCHLIIKRLS
jgi:hypothetical protein